MPLKVDIQMALCGQTWTESHYYLAGSGLPFPGPVLQQLCSSRAVCLGATASVIGADISDVPGNRLVQPIAFDNGGYISKFPPNQPPDAGQAATPNNSLLITMTSTNAVIGPVKKLYLASPPQGTISSANNARDELGIYPGFNAALAQYMSLLTGNVKQADVSSPPQATWGYRARDSTNQVSGATLTVGPSPFFQIGVTIPAALAGIGTGPGQTMEVYLRGFKRINPRLPGLSGPFRIASISFAVPPAGGAVTYSLFNSAGILVSNFSSTGTIAPLQYKYPAYGPYWYVEKAVTRKRGESVGRRRGRSPARR